MEAINQYFNQLKGFMQGEMYTADIGTIDKVNGNEVDVSVHGKPLLINLPTLTTTTEGTVYRVGDSVLVVYQQSNISKGVVVGKVQ